MPFLLAVLVPCLGALPAGQATDARTEAWVQDVRFVAAEIERLHPDPYFAVSREEFQAAVADFECQVSGCDEDRAVVELMRLVALLSREGREGHSGVFPLGFHLLPVQIYRFAEGWFVVAAPPEHAALVGLRVTALGDLPVDAAVERVAPLLARDNDSQRISTLAWALLMTEVLHVLEVTPERDAATLHLTGAQGAEQEVVLAGQSIAEYRQWNRYPPVTLPADPAVPWLAPSRGPFWYQVLDEEDALYVRYDEIAPVDASGRSVGDFAREVVDTFLDLGLDRVVLDLRNNGGGNNTTFPPFLDALRGCPDLNCRGHLYALVGRGTFSAAGNFITVLQRDTEALLVGEDTGGAPNQYGDAQNVFLPNHPQVLVRVATRYHCFGGPEDRRLTHEPDLPVPLPAAAYFSRQDPVLARALED